MAGTSTILLTDSKSNLHALQKVRTEFEDAEDLDLRRELKALCNRSNFVKLKFVKAHEGLIGNETADELARQGLTLVKEALWRMEQATEKADGPEPIAITNSVTLKEAKRLAKQQAFTNLQQKVKDVG